MYDVAAAETSLVSRTVAGPPPNDPSDFPSISGSGAIVAYESLSPDLVPGTRSRTEPIYAYRVW